MMTEAQKQEHKKIRITLVEHLTKLLPDFSVTAWGFESDRIRVEVDAPREYMGRFDSGKVNWTIDVSEVATYSRTKQVRVKIVCGVPTFDEAKLLQLIASANLIVAKHDAQHQATQDAISKLPPLPYWMHAESTPTEGVYNVSVHLKMTLEQIAELKAYGEGITGAA
jgi:hypothetical protein